MNNSTENMMIYLVSFIVVLVLAIAIPIVLSLTRKKKPELSIEKVNEKVVSQDQQTSIVKLKQETEIKPEVKPAVTLEEKNISVSEALQKTEENFFGRIKKAFSSSTEKCIF